MADAKVYKNFINGEWVDSVSGETFENRNPANTDEVVGIFQNSNSQDVKNAVDAASEAYKKWRLVPAPKRAEILYRVGQRLWEHKEEFSQQMTREMGKVIAETRGDTQEAIDMTFYMAGEGRRLLGTTTPSELQNKFCMTVRQPLGVCGFITPWNFPMAIPSWKMMPALICGNTIVIKPATDTPLSVVNLIQTCHDEGIPAGVVNMVTGSGGKVGVPLIEDERTKVISFTGSTEVGRSVAKACAPMFKHSCLEMGGKNVQIVMEDANLELAVDGALWGAFGTTGQRCTATSRLIIQESVYDKVVEMLTKRASALKVGNGLDESVQMGPNINQDQQDTVMNYIAIAKKEGCTLKTGGEKLTGGAYDKGYFMQPTIFADVTQKHTIWREEIFGPVLAVSSFKTFDQAVEMANDTIYGLSASIFTNDIRMAYAAMRDINTGLFYVNAPTIGAETHLPFGGTKQTGNGHREATTAALDVYSEWKAISVDFSGTVQRAQIDNQ